MEQNVTNALEKLRSKGVAESLAKMFKVSFGQTHQAYHGTDKKFAEMIISNGFSIKENEKNWFGNGIYFFEWSFSEAQNWAKNIKKFNPPVVIKCIIKYGKSLRLTEESHCKIVREFKLVMENTLRIPIKEPAAIDALAYLADIDTIKGVNVKGNHSHASYRG